MRQWRVLLVLLPAASLCAGTIYNEVADAGNNIGTAQIVRGAGPLTEIRGHLMAPGDPTGWVDVFGIFVTDTMHFYAVTSGEIPDPELFIFDRYGNPLEGNRDISSSDHQSYLTGGEGTPDLYYLWISAQYREPGYAAWPYVLPIFPPGGVGEMVFPFREAGPLLGPVGPISSANLGGSNYAYTITLTGVEYVPEPGSAGLLLAGVLLLAGRRIGGALRRGSLPEH